MAAIYEHLEPEKSKDINGLSILLVKRSYEPLISPLTKIISSEHWGKPGELMIRSALQNALPPQWGIVIDPI